VVEGDGASAEEDEAKGERGEARGIRSRRSPISPLWKCTFAMATDRSMQMAKAAARVNRPISTRRPPKELGKGGEIGHPGRESEAGNEVSVVVKSAEDLVISVSDHDGAKGVGA
jgi:hypothetical protein